MTKKRRGHYCWACGCTKSNESFSGRGHSKHICKECSKLSASELAVRQGIRNIEQCLSPTGTLQRKSRATFEKFLVHPNTKVREYALRCQNDIDEERRRYKEMLEHESEMIEAWEYDVDHKQDPEPMAEPHDFHEELPF